MRPLGAAALLCAWTLGAADDVLPREIGAVGEEDSADKFHRCLDPEDSGSAIVDDFPRFAADMQRVPSGPEEYVWFRWNEQCSAAPMMCIHQEVEGIGRWRPEGSEWGEPCEAGCYELDVMDAFDPDTARVLPADSAGRYVQGAVSFAALFLVLAFVALSFGFLCMGWTFCGACLCCCCKAKRAFPCCCLNASRKKDENGEYIVDDGIPANIDSCFYKQKTKFCFRLFVIVPLTLMMLMLFLGAKNASIAYLSCASPLYVTKHDDHVTKTGSGQTCGKEHSKKRCDALLAVAGNARGNTQFVDSVNALVEAPRGFASISNDAFLLGDHVLELPLEILNEIVAINRVSERAASEEQGTARRLRRSPYRYLVSL
jgi:hypothetical protein